MNPAEFKTGHESLGVSTDFLTKRVGVNATTIWKYERTDRGLPVPEHAAEVMRGLLDDFESAVERTSAEAVERGWILRHVPVEAFYEAVPELAGWGPLAQGLLLAEVQRRVSLPIEYSS